MSCMFNSTPPDFQFTVRCRKNYLKPQPLNTEMINYIFLHFLCRGKKGMKGEKRGGRKREKGKGELMLTKR